MPPERRRGSDLSLSTGQSAVLKTSRLSDRRPWVGSQQAGGGVRHLGVGWGQHPELEVGLVRVELGEPVEVDAVVLHAGAAVKALENFQHSHVHHIEGGGRVQSSADGLSQVLLRELVDFDRHAGVGYCGAARLTPALR